MNNMMLQAKDAPKTVALRSARRLVRFIELGAFRPVVNLERQHLHHALEALWKSK